MQTDFFGTVEDKKLILDFIFSETNYLVFDHYSEFGEELKQYFSTSEILEKFDLENGKQNAVTFGLWNPLDKTKNIVRKVTLDPKYCNGHTFRYTSEGWGIQRLYFGGIQNGFLNASQFMGFNEKGAIAKDSIHPDHEQEAHQLDWKLIRSDQTKLKNYIEKKLGAEKHTRGIILKNANQLITHYELKI
ncbi:Uncharacterised protein [Chryseobacterium nakagawai]|uniref:Uncharacterized protein n=1 Tax=Chryseobacterium nakagawai TaxID=1241982 RepID=A0AAD1DQR9_CHRNA|nr:hypothetical protein [Chryseobacterium nakagawai]AZA91026.1 hypothetical protein EG343_10460 [Chryseobacterium nakagawai]VEH22577.1 Uncharacterised protein [Chryseobacterium nakagawai]